MEPKGGFVSTKLNRFGLKRRFLALISLIGSNACGSGGFLLYALDHIRHEANHLFPNHEHDAEEATQHFRYWHDFAKNNLYGLEINDEIARVAKMNMIIHDDGHTNVLGKDPKIPPELSLQDR